MLNRSLFIQCYNLNLKTNERILNCRGRQGRSPEKDQEAVLEAGLPSKNRKEKTNETQQDVCRAR